MASMVVCLRVDGEVDKLAHLFILTVYKQPCDTGTVTLSPLWHLSPQRMVTRFYKAVTAPAPIVTVPVGRPLLPLSPCIISLHMVL